MILPLHLKHEKGKNDNKWNKARACLLYMVHEARKTLRRTGWRQPTSTRKARLNLTSWLWGDSCVVKRATRSEGKKNGTLLITAHASVLPLQWPKHGLPEIPRCRRFRKRARILHEQRWRSRFGAPSGAQLTSPVALLRLTDNNDSWVHQHLMKSNWPYITVLYEGNNDTEIKAKVGDDLAFNGWVDAS